MKRLGGALLVFVAVLVGGDTPRAQQAAPSAGPAGPRLPASAMLAPTIHPPVSLDVSRLWLAPSDNDTERAARVRSGALVSFQTGVRLQAEKKYEEALPLLSAPALADTPLADYALYYTALVESKLLRLDDARRTLAALRVRKPEGYLSEAATLGEAEVAETQGDNRGALRLYDQLLRRKPLAADDVWLRIARAAMSVGDRARAAEAYAHLYYEFPLSDLAAQAEPAIETMPEIEPIRPSNARYKFELGRAQRLFGAKRYADARAGFERLRPHAAGDDKELIALRLAECDYSMHRYRSAREGVRPYLDRGAHRAEARFFDVMSTRGLGAAGEFARLARELVTHFPDSTWAEDTLNNLASYYIQRDQDETADVVLRELYGKFPDGRYAERAAWKIGWRAYRNGRPVEAAQIFEQTAASFPRSDYRPAYLYWAARSHDALGDRVSANARYALVTADYLNSYYGRLAARALLSRGTRPASSTLIFAEPSSLNAPTGAHASAGLPPTHELIRLLLALELYDDAMHELQYAQKMWGDSPTLQATIGWVSYQQGELASGARQFTLFRRAINSMKGAYPQYMAAGGESLPRELLSVIFPLEYWNLIKEYAAKHGLDPYLLAALIAQESTFVPDIRSSANAVGLMQLLPSTGRRYARELRLGRYSSSMLTNPATNIRMGTAYFSELMKQFGEAHLALASYNAGERRVRSWLAERPGLDREEFIDDIPFPETQNYVKKILGTAEDYRRLYGEGVLAKPAMRAKRKAASKAPAKRTAARKPTTRKAPARPGE